MIPFVFPVRREPPRRGLHGGWRDVPRAQTRAPPHTAGALSAARCARACAARRAARAQTRQGRHIRVSGW